MIDSKKTKKIYEPFQFKQFSIEQDRCAMKVGTDGVLLGAWCNIANAQSVLDVGTGTGVIAIMLAQRNQEVQIKGLEVDEEASQQARNNMKNAPWSPRLEVVHQSVQDFAKFTTDNFDLIVSNPPFFSGGTFSDNHNRNNVRHTIKLPHGELLTAVRTLLTKEGTFSIILPFIEGLRFQELASNYRLYCKRLTRVKSRPDGSVVRLLMEFGKKDGNCSEDELIIYQQTGEDYSEEYVLLTKDFYLKM